ncbi:MAG: SPOR domain-containing protein [Microscillaceae bacterium]|nr:SPOR domain-containing protein [Microscillaceae bacterium]
MNTFKLLIALILISYSIDQADAQSLTKDQIKSLKKELKDLEKDPGLYQKMKEEEVSLNQQIRDKESLIADQSYLSDELNREIKKKEEDIELLRKELSDLNNQLTSSTVAKDTSTFMTPKGGVYFSVQIGAYRNEKIAEILKENSNFSIEVDNNSGLKKYMIGKFNSYKEAKNLSKMLAKAGAQCFVVGFKDNARVSHLKQLPEKYF